MNQPTKESFLKNIKDHQVEIIKDDGLYRHIKCQKLGTWNQGFNIITFPGGLLYTGDMGTYEFERIEDMFAFFRDPDNNLHIDSGYYAEKCKSESLFGDGIREFDPKMFKERVKEHFEEYYEDSDSEEKDMVWDEIELQILDYTEDSEWSLMAAFNDFSSVTDFEFQDFWDGFSGMSKTHYFIWCLYAIVWTVQKYDEIKA